MNTLIAQLQFKKGQIIKMAVAERSHVTNPYYVKVKEWDGFTITLTIPNQHDLTFSINSLEWGYHVPRMTIVGMFDEYGHLLHDQKLD